MRTALSSRCRLRARLTDIFPGQERALDLTNTGPLILLTGYQTPASLRRTGKKRLEAWLRNRKVLPSRATGSRYPHFPSCPGPAELRCRERPAPKDRSLYGE
ncbi:hypothetical protein GCM10018966_095860 [Streptomyces yanii]